MMSKEDEDFLRWWELNRDRERKWERSIRKGLGMGLMLSLPIVMAVLFRGWYKRMPFISGSQLFFILLGCLMISVFYAVMKGRMQWEANETKYRQIKGL